MRTFYKIVDVGLYLHGENLDPEEISKILGVFPSRVHRKGDKNISPKTGREYVPWKQGLWKLVLNRNHAEVTNVMTELLTALGKVDLTLTSLPGVQNAYFDVFISGMTNRNLEGRTCEFELEGQQLAALARFGVPIQFTTVMYLEQELQQWEN
jgi:hypothetical protein